MVAVGADAPAAGEVEEEEVENEDVGGESDENGGVDVKLFEEAEEAEEVGTPKPAAPEACSTAAACASRPATSPPGFPSWNSIVLLVLPICPYMCT